MQAKFSMEFTLAVIAVHRRAGLSEFTNEMLRRPDTVKMMRRVYYTAYETADAGFTNVTTFVDVRLSDGRTVSGRADYARGSTTDRWILMMSPASSVNVRNSAVRMTAVLTGS